MFACELGKCISAAIGCAVRCVAGHALTEQIPLVIGRLEIRDVDGAGDRKSQAGNSGNGLPVSLEVSSRMGDCVFSGRWRLRDD